MPDSIERDVLPRRATASATSRCHEHQLRSFSTSTSVTASPASSHRPPPAHSPTAVGGSTAATVADAAAAPAAALRASAHAREYVLRCVSFTAATLASPSHASSGTTSDGATQLWAGAARARTRTRATLASVTARAAACGACGTRGGGRGKGEGIMHAWERGRCSREAVLPLVEAKEAHEQPAGRGRGRRAVRRLDARGPAQHAPRAAAR